MNSPQSTQRTQRREREWGEWEYRDSPILPVSLSPLLRFSDSPILLLCVLCGEKFCFRSTFDWSGLVPQDSPRAILASTSTCVRMPVRKEGANDISRDHRRNNAL